MIGHDMTLAVEFMTGVCFLLMGLSLVFHKRDWLSWLENAQAQGRCASFSYGMINILIGTFIVSFHWIWEGLAMITTIIGVIAMLKGVVYMLCPGWLPAKLSFFLEDKRQCAFQLSGFLMAVFAAVILYDWWVQMQPLGYTG